MTRGGPGQPAGEYTPRVRHLELWLVRHGETTRNRDGRLAGWANVRLTARGRAQAAALKDVLAGERFAGVWSSDLARARTTARIAWGGAVADARLREIDFGRLEGVFWNDLKPAFKEPLLRFDGFAAPGGESILELIARVRGFVGELAPGRNLIFSHGGVIRSLTREAGDDGFQPTGSLVVLDWSRRHLVRRWSPAR